VKTCGRYMEDSLDPSPIPVIRELYMLASFVTCLISMLSLDQNTRQLK
jgi:hypothetical protein